MQATRRRGQLRRLPNGRWRVRIQGRQPFSGTYETKDLADRALTEEVGRRYQGQVIESTRLPILALLEEWVSAISPTIRPRTLHDYRSLIRRYLVGAPVATVALRDAQPHHLHRPILALVNHGKTTAARQLHALMRQAFRWAVRARRLTWNPMDAVSPPRVPRQVQAVFSPEQASQLVAEAADDPLGPLWILQLGTGLRGGEALALRWGDIQRETLFVQRNLVVLSGPANWALAEPKSRSGIRHVALPRSVVAALARQRRRVAEMRLQAGSGWSAHDLIFPSASGTPLDPGNVRRRWKRFCQRAGLPVVRLYTLRHTCASLLLASGGSPKAIAESLGHSNVVMLMQTYAHTHVAERRALASVMDGHMSGDPCPPSGLGISSLLSRERPALAGLADTASDMSHGSA